MPAIFGRWPSHKLNLVAVTVFLCLAATSFSTAYESALILRDTNSKLVFSHFVLVPLLLSSRNTLQPRSVELIRSPVWITDHFPLILTSTNTTEHSVGLTINYTSNDWNTQMKLAASHNIDAFVLNVGKPVDWQVAQVSRKPVLFYIFVETKKSNPNQ